MNGLWLAKLFHLPENGIKIRKVNKCATSDNLARSLQPRHPERGWPLSRIRRILTRTRLKYEDLERPGTAQVGVWGKAEGEALVEIHIQNKLSSFLPIPPTHTENSLVS